MNNQNIKFAFWGTPKIASDTLSIMKNCGYIPSLIITSIDKPSGRGMQLTESPVSIWAKENNIECLKPEKINEEFLNELNSKNLDIYIVVAYGKILGEELINLPKLGTINIHYSLLPKYRGASPVEQALLNGDATTGISIQQMKYKLDSGPILESKEVPIYFNESKEELFTKLIEEGANMLCNILPKIINKEIIPKEQDEKDATFCSKIKKEDGLLNLEDNGRINYNKYRAYKGWPDTYFFTKNNKRIKVSKARYENDLFIIEKVIPEGKKEVNYSDFLKSNI